MLSINTANHVQMEMKHYVTSERKHQQLTVAQLAECSGVPYGTLRKFESSGKISLSQFLMLLEALGKLNALQQLAAPPHRSKLETMLANQCNRQL